MTTPTEPVVAPTLRGNFVLSRGKTGRSDTGEFRFESGDFAIPLEGVTAIFAPSGAGKTSFLRAIAGLETSMSGALYCGDDCWLDGRKGLSPHRRRIGFVFQGGALFPQRTVAGNLEFAARRVAGIAGRRSRPEWQAAVAKVAETIGITALLQRSVNDLSGGERQRVAIARALLVQPRLLCLDEPLAALDRGARHSLMNTIDALAHAAGIPILYVTHDAQEVERLATRVQFLSRGRLESLEDLQVALARTDSPLFADEGPAAVLEGQHVPEPDGHCGHFVTHGGTRIHLPNCPQAPANGTRRLRILASDVGIARDALRGVSIQNQLPVRIVGMDNWRPGRTLLRLSTTASEPLFAEITSHSAVRLGLECDQVVHALIKSVALVR